MSCGQIGGSLAKVVYFTRSPDPPSSPSIAATHGSSTVSDVSTPGSLATPISYSPIRETGTPPPLLSSSPPPPPNPRINGALTPAILDPAHHGVGHAPTPASLDQLDHNTLRDSLLRRVSVQHFPGGSLNFERHETEHIDECVRFIQSSTLR